ncbi:hypothetical protein A2U01_0098875, partial [Trifolium medium]|nr:hypothetical protein [Trifolium medium]
TSETFRGSTASGPLKPSEASGIELHSQHSPSIQFLCLNNA